MQQMFLKIREVVIRKKVIVSLVAGTLFLMGVVMYQYLHLIRVERTKKMYFDKIQNLEEIVTENRGRLENKTNKIYIPNITNIDAAMVQSGWIKYENESKKVHFEYPSQYIKLSELTQGDVWDLTLLSKRTKDFNDRYISLVHLSNKLSPATYGDINTPNEVIVGKYEIQGKKYDVWKYGMGEGSACGGGSIHTEVVKLREDLFVHLETLIQQKNVNSDCQGDKYNEIKTSEFELGLVGQILKTVGFDEFE